MNNELLVPFDLPQIINQSSLLTDFNSQCDACSPVIFTEHNVPEIHYSHTYGLPHLFVKQLIDPYHLIVSSLFAKTCAVLNMNALLCLQQFESPRSLDAGIEIITSQSRWEKTVVQTTIEQMVSLGLLVPVDKITQQANAYIFQEVPDSLVSWLHLTNRCNLRCTYCYVPHYDKDMTIEIGKAAIEATFRSAHIHAYKKVKFKYAGGEPLLQFPLLLELHNHTQELATHYGIKAKGRVLTNGILLTKEMVKRMQALKLDLTISLDNIPSKTSVQKENFHRTSCEGQDASPEAMQAIELALDYGLTPTVSITVSTKNVNQLADLLAWVLSRNIQFNLNFYRITSNNLDEPNGLKLEEEIFIKGMLSAYKIIEANLPKQSLLTSLVDLSNLATPHLRRCSVGHSYLVFDCDGKISKCQMQMNQPSSDTDANDPLVILRSAMCGIQNVTVNEKEGCQGCQWQYWCAGGCSLETFRMTGSYRVKSPYCNIYKSLYPEVLRLEGLRLLKYANKEAIKK